MAEQVRITSVDALEAFRAKLIVYLSKARPLVEDVSTEVLRTRVWLQSEQRLYWEHQLKRRTRDLENAQQALFSAGISNLREATTAEVAAVNKAKRAVAEAEAKLRLVKQWSREFDSRIEPVLKQLEKLHTVLTHELPHGVAFLTQALNTLAAYAEMAAPSVGDNPANADAPKLTGEDLTTPEGGGSPPAAGGSSRPA